MSPSRTVPVPVEDLQRMWRDLAHRYFDNRLPPITIEWSYRLTASTGMFVSRVSPRNRHVSIEERHGVARRIRLSAPLLHDQSESEILRTLAHEMIHQWQYDVKKRFPNHGREFYEVMARMNRDGMQITIRHSLDQQVERLSKYLWKCVACGRTYRRQRRTISSHRHRCGSCHGSLREVPLKSLTVGDQTRHHDFHADQFSCSPPPHSKMKLNPQQLSFNF